MTTSEANGRSAPEQQEPLEAGELMARAVVAAPVGALMYGVLGSIGKCSLSFFTPMASAGGFLTFAGMGALACPLIVIPHELTKYFINKSPFFKNHPKLKTVLTTSLDLLLHLGVLTAAAAILGFPPLGATVISLLVVPVVLDTLVILYNALDGFLSCVQGVPEIVEPVSALNTPA